MKFIERRGKITNREYPSVNPEISDRTARNDLKIGFTIICDIFIVKRAWVNNRRI